MPVCPSCKFYAKEGQRFCIQCGLPINAAAAAQPAVAAPKTFCEQCGRGLDRLMKFCKYCGAVQKSFTAQVVSPATERISAAGGGTSLMTPDNFATVIEPDPSPISETEELPPDSFATTIEPMPMATGEITRAEFVSVVGPEPPSTDTGDIGGGGFATIIEPAPSSGAAGTTEGMSSGSFATVVESRPVAISELSPPDFAPGSGPLPPDTNDLSDPGFATLVEPFTAELAEDPATFATAEAPILAAGAGTAELPDAAEARKTGEIAPGARPAQTGGLANSAQATNVLGNFTERSTGPMNDQATGLLEDGTTALTPSTPIKPADITGGRLEPPAEPDRTEIFNLNLRTAETPMPAAPAVKPTSGGLASPYTREAAQPEPEPAPDQFKTILEQPTTLVSPPPAAPPVPSQTETPPTRPIEEQPFIPTAPMPRPADPPPEPTPVYGAGLGTGVQPVTQRTFTGPSFSGDVVILPDAKREAAQRSGWVGPLALVAALVLLMSACGVGAYFMFFHNRGEGPEVAQNEGDQADSTLPDRGNTSPGSGGTSTGPSNPPRTPSVSDELAAQQERQRQLEEQQRLRDRQRQAESGQQGQQSPSNPPPNADEQRRAEEQRRAAEQRRLDEQRRQQEEQQRAAEQQRLEEQRRQDEQRRLEEERRAAEQRRQQQEQQQAEANLPRNGVVRWSGTANGRYNVIIRGSSTQAQALSGGPIESANYSFSNAIPARQMKVFLQDKRGKVRLIQAPGPSNNYVIIVQVEGNNDRVSFSIRWELLNQ